MTHSKKKAPLTRKASQIATAQLEDYSAKR